MSSETRALGCVQCHALFLDGFADAGAAQAAHAAGSTLVMREGQSNICIACAHGKMSPGSASDFNIASLS